MAIITIDSEVLGALIRAADDGAQYLAELADECAGDADGREIAEDYRSRSAAADAAVTAARSLWSASYAAAPSRKQRRSEAYRALNGN